MEPMEKLSSCYFGGRFPGKIALNQIVKGWQVPVKTHHHNSGWIIFQFGNSENQMTVLENSPYVVYGKPLHLKIMPQNFRFQNEGICCFPVWVQIHDLPMEYWNPRILGKICTRIGKPIHMDKLTTYKERVSFARCLVEIDMAKDLPQAVMLKLTSGEIIEQPILYENLPRFCKLCRVTVEGCSVQKKKPKSKQKEAEGTTGALNTDLDEVAAAAETTTTQAAHKGKRGQTEGVQNANQLAQDGAGATATGQAAQLRKKGKAEWVQVHVRSSKIQPDSRNIIPNAGPVLGNKFSALAETLETEVERLRIQETDPAQSQVSHYGKRNQGSESAQSQSDERAGKGCNSTSKQTSWR